MKKLVSFAGLAALALATPAFAHPGAVAHTHGFLNGLAHPVTGLDHILVMLGVGIWSALVMPANRVLVAPVAFVAAMLAGAVLGVSGVPLPGVEIGIAVSVIAIGLLIALRLGVPVALAAAIIGAFGALHGYAHGAEAQGGVLSYMAGFTITTATLHLAGIGVGRLLLTSRWVSIAAGAAMTAAGLGILVS